MRRGIAVTWHLVSFLIASVLYFFFVLPRWPELMGDTSHGLGTAARILTGVLFGFSAVPVVFTLLKAQRPEFGTPRLALTLQTWSIIGHVTAGLLIIGTAIAEIWLDLDTSGRWLFAVYGAAAGVALLSAAAFYLSFAAELPPPPPKPLKPKNVKARDLDGEDSAQVAPDTQAEPVDEQADAAVEETESTDEADSADGSDDAADTGAPADDAAKPARSALRNRRRRKQSDGVSVAEN